MRSKMLVTLGVLALAAGCTTMTPEERRAADEEKCRSYGFTRKNDAFAACLQRINLDRRAQRRADSLAFQRGYYDPWFYRPAVVYRPVLTKKK
jgi:hypothetical protein